MGILAAETVVRHIAGTPSHAHPKLIQVDPELVVRESTCRVKDNARK
jgi:DNA-binding LacI/PurR family transcriptional regulator